jgi:peptidoglycan/LPS O-acetylase OafA/YrhL
MGKVKLVEGIRGIACVVVILSHLLLTFFPHVHGFDLEILQEMSVLNIIHDFPFGFLYAGGAAVYIFFVLSYKLILVRYIFWLRIQRADEGKWLLLSE